MAEPLRHRQTKEAATDMFSLQPPRHIPTLPNHDPASGTLTSAFATCGQCACEDYVKDVPIAVLESCLLQTQYGECLLRPMDCLPQGDFRPAETHRDPSCDQLQHKLAGVTTIVRQVIGKLDADAPLFWHHPHFKWRRACRKAVPEHRQPVSLGEVEEHCRITALGDDPSGGGIGLEPMLFKILLPHNASHAILSIQDQACSAVGIEHGRRRSQLLELTSGFLATRAVAGSGQNRRADGLEFHLTALA